MQDNETERGKAALQLSSSVPLTGPAFYSTSGSGSYGTAPDKNKPSLAPNNSPEPSLIMAPRPEQKAAQEIQEIVLPGLVRPGGATALTLSRQAIPKVLPATGTINPMRQGREAGG